MKSIEDQFFRRGLPRHDQSTLITHRHHLCQATNSAQRVPEPDPLPGIFSNTQPDPILKNPTQWALFAEKICKVVFEGLPKVQPETQIKTYDEQTKQPFACGWCGTTNLKTFCSLIAKKSVYVNILVILKIYMLISEGF